VNGPSSNWEGVEGDDEEDGDSEDEKSSEGTDGGVYVLCEWETMG
jgi:hypothetical protein